MCKADLNGSSGQCRDFNYSVALASYRTPMAYRVSDKSSAILSVAIFVLILPFICERGTSPI
jgi:hypothetical protein